MSAFRESSFCREFDIVRIATCGSSILSYLFLGRRLSWWSLGECLMSIESFEGLKGASIWLSWSGSILGPPS